MPTHVTAGWWSSMLLRLHHGNALPVAPWHVPRSPLAALALLLSAVAAPVFQVRHIVSAMINYRPDEMWRLWKCHRDDMGLSVWASREERIAHRHLEGYGAPAARCLFKERTPYYLSWFLLDLCNSIFYLFYYICTLAERSPSLDFKMMSSVVSLLIKWNVNPIRVKPIHHATSENAFSLLTQQSLLADSEWPVNT